MCNVCMRMCVPVFMYYIYTTGSTIGAASSNVDEFLAERSQFDTDHDQMRQACADRSGNGSYLNKLAP